MKDMLRIMTSQQIKPLITLQPATLAKEEFFKQAKSHKINISAYAREMIDQMTDFNLTEPVELVVVSVSELGFSDLTTTQAIYDKAQEIGLELVPPAAALHARLHYLGQPAGEWLYVAMKPITVSGAPRVFELWRAASSLWLRNEWAGPDRRWDPPGRFVFRVRGSETQQLKASEADPLALRPPALSVAEDLVVAQAIVERSNLDSVSTTLESDHTTLVCIAQMLQTERLSESMQNSQNLGKPRQEES